MFSDESKILVIMSDNRDIEPNLEEANFVTWTTLTNYNYCKKHGYDFKYFLPSLNPNWVNPSKRNSDKPYNCLSPSNQLRHPAWSKILSTLKSIEQNKWDLIVYIDSDCIFTNQSQKITDYLRNSITIHNQPLDENKLIYFLNNYPYGDEIACSGFYVIKNSSITKRFLKDWYLNDSNPVFDSTHAFEQVILNDYIIPKYSEYIDIIDDIMFKRNGDNQFLSHISSGNTDRRELIVSICKRLDFINPLPILFDELKKLVYKFDTQEYFLEM